MSSNRRVSVPILENGVIAFGRVDKGGIMEAVGLGVSKVVLSVWVVDRTSVDFGTGQEFMISNW